MSGVAIVAIPNKSDPVWAVSSEKIPHMTLLFLGDALSKEDYRQVQEFVTHVADVTLPSFGMSVDKRDTLGDSDADVLFFKNNDKSRISLFRSYLLQDSIIREAYESVEQFEGWTPHLTLGYPETPAKKDPREDSEFYWVNFDRIMIWTGEYEGPEIELKSEDLELAMDGFDENLAQSDLDELDAFLAHFGVKGMRWGVRKSLASQERSAARSEKKTTKNEKAAAKLVKIQTKQAKEAVAVNRANARKAARVDKPGRPGSKKEWVQKSLTQAKAQEVMNAAAPRIIKDVSALQASMPNRKLSGRERRAYDRQALDIVNQHLDTASRSVVGVSPNGRKTATASMTPNGTLIMRVTRTKTAERRGNTAARLAIDGYLLSHANSADSFDEFEFKVLRDKNGFIEGFEMIDEDLGLTQSDLDELDTFLAHFGVKGMRWGVRKDALTTGRYGSTHGPVRAGVRLGGDKRPSGIDKLSDKYNRTDLGKVTTTVTRVLSSGPYTAFQTASLVALTGATALSAGATAPVTATVIGAIIGQSAATHGLHAAWANKDNVRRINNNPKYKGKNLKADKKLRKEYHDEQMHSLGRALWDPRGVRLAETRARVTGNPGDKSIVVKPYGLIEHSIEDVSLTIDVVYNDTGHILEFVPRVPEDIAKKFYEIVNNDGNMAQSDLDELDAFLAHFGVKGMRWGVRRSAEERRADRTARVQARSEKSIAKAKEYQTRAEAKTAVANAKTAAAKAKVATADAKTGEATARLETKVAKRETKLAKTEARTGVDDPANGYVRESSALAGKSDRQAVGNRKGAAKDVRTLDDQTLKAYTERLSTEKRLKDAIAEDTAPKKTAAKKLINDVGKDLAKKALIGAGSLAIYYVLSTKGGKEPYRVKSSAEGMGRLLSGAPKTSGKDAFTVPKFNSPPPPSINKRKAKSF